MKINEVAKIEGEQNSQIGTGSDAYQIIKNLSVRSFPEAPLEPILKEMNIELHDVMNPDLRPDKKIYKPKALKQGTGPYKNLNGGINPLSKTLEPEMEYVRTELVNRIPLSFQELIVNKRVSFCLANPAIRSYAGVKDEEQLERFKFGFERILFDNKIKTHDQEIARQIFGYTEVAEYWYPDSWGKNSDGTPKRSMRYGFDTNIKLKVATYTRINGYKFFPIKDQNGNMICFSMQFQVRENGRMVTYFRTFTDEETALYKRTGAWNWQIVGKVDENKLGKIPIVFGWQLHPEFRNAKWLIKRLEKLLSNHGEVNDYHAAPKLFLSEAENITGVGAKGESGIVLQGKGKADAKYITWDNATASVKLEIDNTLNMIYTLTQTPNINFDNIKGMGAVSGVSIKLLFMDAHLAVKDKEGLITDLQQRRHSIISSYIAQMEPQLAAVANQVEITSKLDPFMIADDKENAEIAQIQNGNQPTKSQKTTVIEAGGDEEEYDLILEETKARNLLDVSEPTI